MRLSVVVDRIESEYAVVELDVDDRVDFPLQYLPDGIKEGSRLIFDIRKED